MSSNPELLDDARGLAAEYRDAGWDCLVIEPKTVVPTTADPGFEVRVDEKTLARVDEAVTAGEGFGASQVYRHESDGRRTYLVAVEDEPTETVLVLPLSISADEADAVVEAAREDGRVLTRIHADGEDVVAFAHDDPSLF